MELFSSQQLNFSFKMNEQYWQHHWNQDSEFFLKDNVTLKSQI